jgi:mono/diheme cytochrome c family protein
MNALPARVAAWMGGASLAMLLLAATEPPKERDIRLPRVPADRLTEVRAMVNPVPANDESLARGKELFTLACVACHGADGTGHGPLTKKSRIDPSPRNFTNPEFQRLRTDGELFWVLKQGSHDTEMMRMEFFFTDEELWTLVRYIRLFAPPRP